MLGIISTASPPGAAQVEPTTSKQAEKLRERGLHDDLKLNKTLVGLFPALDLHWTHPVDAAHPEYAGLAEEIHKHLFLNDGLLTPKAWGEVPKVYQSFTFPPRCRKLQSPTRHLKSWRIGELAVGAIILPHVLLSWLRPEHIRIKFQGPIKVKARTYFNKSQLPSSKDPFREFSASEWIVAATWIYSRVILAIGIKAGSLIPPEEIHRVAVESRKAVQIIVDIQITADSNAQTGLAAPQPESITVRPGRAQATVGNRRSGRRRNTAAYNPPASRAGSVIGYERISDSLSVRSRQSGMTSATMKRQREKHNHPLQAKLGLPNTHTGYHLAEVAKNHGACYLVFTLLGEDNHR